MPWDLRITICSAKLVGMGDVEKTREERGLVYLVGAGEGVGGRVRQQGRTD